MSTDIVSSPILDIFLVGVVLAVVGLIVVVGQGLFMVNDIKIEYSRKLIHIGLSIWLACWLFFLPYKLVIVASLLLALAVFISKRLGFLKSIHGVRRTTYGEITYALGIAFVAWYARDNEAVYALAVINLGFADGLAAVIGSKYGANKKKYRFFMSKKKVNKQDGKTLIGASTSFSFAVLSGLFFWVIVPTQPWPIWLIGGHIVVSAAIISGLEFISHRGYDNLIIPSVTAILYKITI